MELENLIELIKAVSDSELTKFSYEENGVKLDLRKEKEQTIVTASPTAVLPQTIARAAEEQSNRTAVPENEMQGNRIVSPLVGTFYASPSPDEEPFIKVGDVVKKGQVLGIIEAMKLMNEIESEYDGTVADILVNNGDIIEYGQTMFVIK